MAVQLGALRTAFLEARVGAGKAAEQGAACETRLAGLETRVRGVH